MGTGSSIAGEGGGNFRAGGGVQPVRTCYIRGGLQPGRKFHEQTGRSHSVVVKSPAAKPRLIERCLAGDDTAHAALVFEHHRLVLGLATHLLGDREEALDLSQEVFFGSSAPCTASGRSRRFAPGSSASSSTRCGTGSAGGGAGSGRSGIARRAHPRSRRDRAGRRASDARSRAHSKESAARLKTAIQNLPFEQRTALVLREIEGLRYEEIAFSLGLPVGTVKSRLTRARQTLRDELGDLRC